MAPQVRKTPPRLQTVVLGLILCLHAGAGFAQPEGDVEKKEMPPAAKARLLQDLDKQVEQRRLEISREEERLSALKMALEAVKRDLRQEQERLEVLKRDVEEQIARRDKVVDERLDQIAGVYKAMKPKEAAKALEDMEDDMAVSILIRLPGRTVGKMFNTMPKDRVRELTRRLEEGRIQRE